MVFKTKYKDVKNQLVRKGFEVVGQIGDNINSNIVYTIHGDENKISKNEFPFIEKLKYERGKSEVFKRRL